MQGDLYSGINHWIQQMIKQQIHDTWSIATVHTLSPFSILYAGQVIGGGNLMYNPLLVTAHEESERANIGDKVLVLLNAPTTEGQLFIALSKGVSGQ